LKELEVLFVSKQILYKYACLNFSNSHAAFKPMSGKVVKWGRGKLERVGYWSQNNQQR